MYGSLLFMLRCIKWPSIVHRAIGTLTPLIQIQDGRYIKIVLVTFSTTFGHMQTFFYLLKICEQFYQGSEGVYDHHRTTISVS